MSQYRKYTDNYLAMVEGLRLDKLGISPLSENVYKKQIKDDKGRSTVVELRDPAHHNAEETRSQIYDETVFETFPYYNQGDYDGTFFYSAPSSNPNLLNKRISVGSDYSAYKGLPYIDDHNIMCGLSLIRVGQEPEAQYIFVLIRNVHAPYTEREVTYICAEKLINNSYYENIHGKHNETILKETDILQHLRNKIGSKSIYQLLTTLFDETTGLITESNYQTLYQRVQWRNLDNRDILYRQNPRILEVIAQFPPQTAASLRTAYLADPVNFFKGEIYDNFLSSMLSSARQSSPPNPALVQACQDLYLEYLIIQEYYDKSHLRADILNQGLPEARLSEIKNKMTDSSDAFVPTDLATRAHQLYKSLYFNEMLIELKHALQICRIPSIHSMVTAQLPWLHKKNQTFSTLKSSHQKTLIAYIEALQVFVESPSQAQFTKLRNLYPKVSLDPSTLDSVNRDMEYGLFKQELLLLKQHITTCAHPYLKRELARHLPFLIETAQSFNSLSLETIHSVQELLSELNLFATKNEIHKLQSVMTIYAQLHIQSPNAEEQSKLLLSLPAALLKRQIDSNRYTFDVQSHLVAITPNSNMSNPTTAWNIDTTSILPEKTQQFNQTLINELHKKQTSLVIAGKIVELLHKAKNNIFPLHTALFLYLNQIADIYQSSISPPIISDEAKDAAILDTLNAISPMIMNALVEGLIRSSFNQRNVILQHLDTNTLNQILIEKQDTLRQQAQSLLREHLKKRCQELPIEVSTTISYPQKMKNRVIMMDSQQSLATAIISMQPESGYTCRQIQNYHCADLAFDPHNFRTKIRVHSTALSNTDNQSLQDYMHQFNHRFNKISDNYNFQFDIPIIYYLYGASDEQVSQTIKAVHEFNRNVKKSEPNSPIFCYLQACDLAESGRTLGYPLLDWAGSGLTSEITLMYEMSLCQQIYKNDNKEFNIQAYYDFLNPSSSLLPKSGLFALRSEGRKMRAQIQGSKDYWQQWLPELDKLKEKQASGFGLKKLMAFDLHFDPNYAVLVQALSLGSEQISIINDESSEQSMVFALGYAQVFDLASLPIKIKEPLNSLLQATDKRNAILAANALKTAFQNYYVHHQNTTVMLPICQKATEAAYNACSIQDIAEVKAHLTSPAKTESREKSIPIPQRPTNPKHKTSKHNRSTRAESPPPPIIGSGFSLFDKQRQPPSTQEVLDRAARNKAAAFHTRKSGGK
jgi:hypothetical protein